MLKFLKNDIINSYDEFYQTHKARGNYNEWIVKENEDYTFFIKLNDTESIPKIISSVKLYVNLTISVTHNDIVLPADKFKWILGESGFCDKWSKLDSLLSHVFCYENSNQVNNMHAQAIRLLKETYEDSVGPTSVKISFIQEQIKLLNMKIPSYSPDLLVFASTMYFSNPHAYTKLRDTEVLTLPHPTYLRKLSSNCDIDSSGFNNSHRRYMQQHLCGLKEDDYFSKI